MDIEQLKAFVLVASTKSFTRSADSLHVVQSTVTSRIQMLEKQMGKRLFIRDNRNIELSLAGRRFLPYAERMVELSREGKKVVQLGHDYQDQLIVGSTHVLWDYVLFPVMNTFQESHPTISMRLITEHSSIIIRKMIDGLIDLGVIFYPVHHANLELIPLIEDTFDLVASPSFAIPEEPLGPNDLHGFPYIHLDWGGSFSNWMQQMFGAHYLFRLEVDHVSLLLKFLHDRQGLGFVPHSVAKHLIEQKALISLPFKAEPPVPKRLIYLVQAKRSSSKENLKKLSDYLREAI